MSAAPPRHGHVSISRLLGPGSAAVSAWGADEQEGLRATDGGAPALALAEAWALCPRDEARAWAEAGEGRALPPHASAALEEDDAESSGPIASFEAGAEALAGLFLERDGPLAALWPVARAGAAFLTHERETRREASVILVIPHGATDDDDAAALTAWAERARCIRRDRIVATGTEAVARAVLQQEGLRSRAPPKRPRLEPSGAALAGEGSAASEGSAKGVARSDSAGGAAPKTGAKRRKVQAGPSRFLTAQVIFIRHRHAAKSPEWIEQEAHKSAAMKQTVAEWKAMNEDRRQPFVFAASLDKQRYDRERAAASGTSGAGGGLGEPGAWTCRVALAENVPRRGWARGVEGEPVDSGGEEGAGRECCYVNRFTRDTCAWCLAPRAGATLPLGARQAIRAALSAADRKSTSTVQLMRHLSVQLGFDVQTSRPDLLQAIDEELQRWESAGQSQLTRPDPFVCGVRLTPAQEARVVATRGSLGAHALAASPVLLSLPPCASPPGASFPWARGWAGRWPPFGDPGADAAWDVVAINAGEPPLMEWQVPAYEHSRGRLAGAAAGALAQRVGVDTSFLSLLSSLRAAARARHGVPQRDVAAACNGAAGVVYALVEGLLRGAARAARSPAEKERASKPTPVSRIKAALCDEGVDVLVLGDAPAWALDPETLLPACRAPLARTDVEFPEDVDPEQETARQARLACAQLPRVRDEAQAVCAAQPARKPPAAPRGLAAPVAVRGVPAVRVPALRESVLAVGRPSAPLDLPADLPEPSRAVLELARGLGVSDAVLLAAAGRVAGAARSLGGSGVAAPGSGEG